MDIVELLRTPVSITITVPLEIETHIQGDQDLNQRTEFDDQGSIRFFNLLLAISLG